MTREINSTEIGSTAKCGKGFPVKKKEVEKMFLTRGDILVSVPRKGELELALLEGCGRAILMELLGKRNEVTSL